MAADQLSPARSTCNDFPQFVCSMRHLKSLDERRRDVFAPPAVVGLLAPGREDRLS